MFMLGVVVNHLIDFYIIIRFIVIIFCFLFWSGEHCWLTERYSGDVYFS